MSVLFFSHLLYAGIHVHPEVGINNQKISPKFATYSTMKEINIDIPKGWFLFNDNGGIVTYFQKITKQNLENALRCELKNYSSPHTFDKFKNNIDKLRSHPKFSNLYIDTNYKFKKKWALIYYKLKGKKVQRLELRRYIDEKKYIIATVIANDYDDNFDAVKKALLSCHMND